MTVISLKVSQNLHNPKLLTKASCSKKAMRKSDFMPKYRKKNLGSHEIIPKHSVLKLRLIDLIENTDGLENCLMDRLSEIPLSYLELPESILVDLRHNNIFPEDELGGLSCCTIGYLIKLSCEESWIDLLLGKWQKLINDDFPGNRCPELMHLASSKYLSLSDFLIPKELDFFTFMCIGPSESKHISF